MISMRYHHPLVLLRLRMLATVLLIPTLPLLVINLTFMIVIAVLTRSTSLWAHESVILSLQLEAERVVFNLVLLHII
jgi:hypothetical protein